jgi:hypothetical protein
VRQPGIELSDFPHLEHDVVLGEDQAQHLVGVRDRQQQLQAGLAPPRLQPGQRADRDPGGLRQRREGAGALLTEKFVKPARSGAWSAPEVFHHG